VPLDLNRSKELFSDAYVRAVVSAARMHVEPRTVDNDSVDGYIHFTGQIGEQYSPQVAYQLKCTSVAAHAGDHIAFPLTIKNYDELRVTNAGVPRILIVVTVPGAVADWVRQDERRMRLFRCGYWMSLFGAPETTNTRTRTVHVPRSQQFTVQSLSAMMARIGEGDRP
jgi:hypothetical protein